MQVPHVVVVACGRLRRIRVVIIGFDLPGRTFCRPDGSALDDVRVGLQLRRDACDLVPGDADEARWEVDLDVVELEDSFDFRGAAVQGKRGDRFIYLTWGNVDPQGEFEMFRRAKLMLNRVDPAVMQSAANSGRLEARLGLTGDDGGPRCARVDSPTISWSA